MSADPIAQAEPFAAFLAAIAPDDAPGGEPPRAEPDKIAAAFARHLASIDAKKLPSAAQPLWHTLVTRLLKSPVDQRPLSPRAMAAIASWPMARIGELIGAVRQIEAEIARAANDRLADETNERVSRAYL